MGDAALDFLHCRIIDPIIRCAAGLRPAEGGLVIDPLPTGPERIELREFPSGVSLHDFKIKRGRSKLFHESKPIAQASPPNGLPLER